MKMRKIHLFLLVTAILVLGQMTAFAQTQVNVSTHSALATALRSSTAQTINVTADIELTLSNNSTAITLGASHTLNIPTGRTFTINGKGIDIGAHTFTISGGGTLLINPNLIEHQKSTNVLTDGDENGTLNLQNITIDVKTIGSVSYSGSIDVDTINVKSGATLNIDSGVTMAVSANKFTVEAYGRINVLSRTGLWMSSKSNPTYKLGNLLIMDGGHIHIGESGGVFVSGSIFEMEGNADLTADVGGIVYLSQSSKVIGMGGKFNDRGMQFETNDETSISATDTQPEISKLSSSNYFWDGSVFRSHGYLVYNTDNMKDLIIQGHAYGTLIEDIVLNMERSYSLAQDMTLVIPAGKTLTLQGEYGLDLKGYTLTVKGGGTLNLNVENDYALASSAEYYQSGRLVLEDITVAINGTEQAVVEDEHAGIYLKSVVVGDGATVKLNAPNANSLLDVVGSKSNRGELTVENGGTIVVEAYKYEAISAQHASITIKTGGKIDIKKAGINTIILREGGSLKLEEGGVFNVATNSQIYLSGTSTIEGMGGMFSDQGKSFTTDQTVVVNDGIISENNKLTYGAYTWNGRLFQKYVYTITYDLNGGSGEAPPADRYASSEIFYVPSYDGTKEGFTFIGWKDIFRSYLYQGGDRYLVDRNATLTAQWEASPTLTITTADQLMQFAADVNSGTSYKGQVVALGGNINLAGKTWVPIGSNNDEYHYFEGTFNGNGHTVSNLTLTNTSDAHYQGFFGLLNFGATIKNFSMENVSINITGMFNETDNPYQDVAQCVGGVVAHNQGTVQNVSVLSGTVKGVVAVGGIAGKNNGNIRDCKNNATVIGSTYAVGGIVGLNQTGVYNSSNSGSVQGNKALQPTFDDRYNLLEEGTGGAVGQNFIGKLTNVFNTGNVSQIGSGTSNVGGVVGYNEADYYTAPSKVINVYNQGAVSGGLNVGGVVGLNTGILKNAYNSGSVTALSSLKKGGIIGEQGRNGEVSNAYYEVSLASGLNSIGSGNDGDSIGTFNKTSGRFITPSSQLVNGVIVGEIEDALDIGAGVYNYENASSENAKGWTDNYTVENLLNFSKLTADPVPPAPTYNIYFQLNGGEHINIGETNTLGKLPVLPTPIRAFFNFVEWRLEDGTRVTVDTVYSDHTSIYAIWESKANIDGVPGVGVGDLNMIADEGNYNKPVTDENRAADINGDNKINFADLAMARNSKHFGE